MAKVFKYILDFEAQTEAFRRSVGGINGMLKSAATAAAGLFATSQIIEFGKASIDAYNNSAQAETALLTALKGRSDVQQHLIGQATELMSKTLFDDDEIVRAQSLVAAFVKEEDKIKSLIPLIQDMATAKQMDLAGAADLVTKTLAGEMNALGRYGIKVEGAAGSSERLAMIQKGLNDAFGGQAEAAAKVGTAALTQLTNEYGNLQEVIGKLTISQQNQEGSFTKILTNATRGVTEFLGEVATWSDAGFSFSQSIVAAFASSDDDTKRLAESMIVVKKETDDSTVATKTYANSIEGLNERLKDYNDQVIKIAPTDRGALMAKLAQIGAIEDQIAKIESLKTALRTMAEDTKSGFRNDKLAPLAARGTSAQNVGWDLYSSVEQVDPTKLVGTDQMNDNLEENKKRVASWREQLVNDAQMVGDAFAQGFGMIGQSIVNGLGLAEDGLEGFVSGLASTVTDLIAMFLGQALASSIAGATTSGAATGPAAIFTTPAFIATAISGVMAAFATIPKFADGGIVYGPTMGVMGEYPGASSNPEIIAPLSKLKDMIGGGNQQILLQPSIELGYSGLLIKLNQVQANAIKRT